ncbi:hypothetical protein C9374_010732 [Naegleria lovaniensis]|uniref:Chitinase domain-containing protein 1 n=1 Tax=Naegleria lovaniensis TaxID=51637 RepID=A0AA88KDU8_NAELO|nr:uncharacterized protein C9374_010732 [Naegleria lovaniensis]KAG2374448.1 hypothetical protein C9374_010732 [Naegleria lovaniensis]
MFAHKFLILFMIFIISASSIHASLRKLSEQEVKDLVQSIQSSPSSVESSTGSDHPSKVLGFVTPWNSGGYDVAKRNNHNIKYISPVWLQLRPSQSRNAFEITGLQDIDMKWMKDVKKNNVGAKLLPRIQFDYGHWTKEHMQMFYGHPTFSKQVHQPVVDRIGQLVRAYDLDGIVLEVGFLQFEHIKHIMVPFLKALKEKLSGIQKTSTFEIYLVVPSVLPNPDNPNIPNALFERDHLSLVSPYVDGFLVMTYDYFSNKRSKNQSTQYVFNSPLKGFIDYTIDYFTEGGKRNDIANKILLGLNFYGVVISTQHLSSKKLLSQLVEEQKNANSEDLISNWIKTYSSPKFDFTTGGKFKDHLNFYYLQSVLFDPDAQEYLFEFVEGDQLLLVVFPTPQTIQTRVQFAKQHNLGGVMIWELGQGLDSFYHSF